MRRRQKYPPPPPLPWRVVSSTASSHVTQQHQLLLTCLQCSSLLTTVITRWHHLTLLQLHWEPQPQVIFKMEISIVVLTGGRILKHLLSLIFSESELYLINWEEMSRHTYMQKWGELQQGRRHKELMMITTTLTNFDSAYYCNMHDMQSAIVPRPSLTCSSFFLRIFCKSNSFSSPFVV